MRPEPSQPDTRKQAFYAQMGVLSSTLHTRSIGLKQFDLWQQMFPTMFDWLDTSVPAVSSKSGQRLTLVYNCLNVLGETVGSLPCVVKRYTENGPESAYTHPVYRLLHDRPNPYMTAFDFWSTVEKLKHIYGNAYALIDRDQYYDPSALYLVDPSQVSIQQTPGTGEIYYKFLDKTIRHTDILHFKNYSTDGLCGISTITSNALSVGLGLKLKNYNSSLIGNRPHGYLTSEARPKTLEDKEQKRKMWNQPDGDSTNRSIKAETIQTQAFGSIPLLYGGVEFHALTLPADQAAYIAGTELNDRDILGMFRVPPTMVSIYKDAPYNSSEQQDIAFVKYTLASLVQKEQECTEKLFPTSNQRREKSYYVKFVRGGILQGDMKAQREFYASGIQNSYLSPNDVREYLELSKVEGGDRYYLQGALVPTDKIDEFIEGKSAKQENQPDNQKAKDEERAKIGEEIRSRLNGHYKLVSDLFD